MPKRLFKEIVGAAQETFAFGTEAASVIVLRLRRIAAGGPDGTAEAELMVREKVRALAHVQRRLLTGAYGTTLDSMARGVGSHYSRAVRANLKRLNAASRGR